MWTLHTRNHAYAPVCTYTFYCLVFLPYDELRNIFLSFGSPINVLPTAKHAVIWTEALHAKFWPLVCSVFFLFFFLGGSWWQVFIFIFWSVIIEILLKKERKKTTKAPSTQGVCLTGYTELAFLVHATDVSILEA